MIGLPLCLMLAYCSTTKTSNDDTANSGTGNTTEMSGSATVGTDVSNSSTSTDMTTSSAMGSTTTSSTGTTDSSSMSDVSMDPNPEVALKNQSTVNNQLSTGTPSKSSGYNYQSNYSVNNPWTPRKSVYEVTVAPDHSPLYGEWSLELTPEVAAIWRLDTASWNNYYAGVRPMNDWLFPNGSYMSGSATVTPYNNADMNVRSGVNVSGNLSADKTHYNASTQNNLSGSVNASGSVNTNSSSANSRGSVNGNTSSPALNNSANPSSMGANNTAGINNSTSGNLNSSTQSSSRTDSIGSSNNSSVSGNVSASSNSATGSNSALRPGAAQTPPSPYANDFRDSSAASVTTSSATNSTINSSNTTSGINHNMDSSANYSSNNNSNYVSGSATSGYNNNLQGAALLTYTDASGATRTWNNQYFIAANGNMYQMPKFNLYIENGSFTGYTGCNNISGRIHIDSSTNAIHFENTTPATAIDCAGGLNETAFLEMLRSIDSYEIMNNQLVLKQGTRTVLSFSKKGNGNNSMMQQDMQTPGTNTNSTETDNNRLMNNNNSTNGSTTTDEKNNNQPK